MNQPLNRAISASAGTGKTFRLAHRYIGLMTPDVPPDRICALTFTRKAAGEIFDKIVELLTDAASNEEARNNTTALIAHENLPLPENTPDAYIKRLRQLLQNVHRLRIGTLDSFILGVVRAFPLELGISPEARPMYGEGGEAQALRQSILSLLLAPEYTSSHDGSSALLTDFRLACSGKENKQLGKTLDQLITESYGVYRNYASEAWHWGKVDKIWPAAERWWEHTLSPATIAEDLADRLASALGGRFGDACAKIADSAMHHAADKPWPDSLSDTILTQLLEQAGTITPAVVTYSRKDYTIPAELWEDLRAALGNLIAVEINRSCKKTHGLQLVLARYHKHYTETATASGTFTFDDLSLLLGTGELKPSLNSEPYNANRLYIDYRLDSQLDHWLLDEFQDTSDNQWQALENLIDEVMQDTSRSFFYVGDVKQSIYGWRGGNHKLFHQVIEKYRALGDRAITVESIVKCYRSLPAVITAVNAIFDDLDNWQPQVPDAGPRPEAVEAFMLFWKKHISAQEDKGEGYAALIEHERDKRSFSPATDDDEEASTEPAAYRAVAAILKDIGPSLKHLSVAILVRDNASGRNYVNALSNLLNDISIVHEGTGGITDHPVVTLLMALVRYAAHPADTLALRHLQMSPLAATSELPSADELPGRILTALQKHVFADTLREWSKKLDNLDDYGLRRLRQLLAAAEEFDAQGTCNIDAFIEHVETYQVKSSTEAGAVRVMTIHQAKGLGFDVVIAPFSANATSFTSPGTPTFLAGDNWVLETPRKTVLEVAGGAPLQARDAAEAESNFAQLCTLYVALTRAKQALYMVVPAAAKKSSTIREADLLRDCLATTKLSKTLPDNAGTFLYEEGDCDWHKKIPTPEISKAEVSNSLPEQLPLSYVPQLERHEPSKEQDETRALPAHWLFSAEAGNVRAFGSAIHRLFEQIEWIETTKIETVIADWRQISTEPELLLNDVEKQFRHCLEGGPIRNALSRPDSAPRIEVWREAPFNLVLPNGNEPRLASGRFDRVVVERTKDGMPIRATIFDYKSNRIKTEQDMQEAAKGYSFQMEIYTRAAAQLLNLDPSCITTLLLFTRKGWIHTMNLEY